MSHGNDRAKRDLRAQAVQTVTFPAARGGGSALSQGRPGAHGRAGTRDPANRMSQGGLGKMFAALGEPFY